MGLLGIKVEQDTGQKGQDRALNYDYFKRKNQEIMGTSWTSQERIRWGQLLARRGLRWKWERIVLVKVFVARNRNPITMIIDKRRGYLQ